MAKTPKVKATPHELPVRSRAARRADSQLQSTRLSTTTSTEPTSFLSSTKAKSFAGLDLGVQGDAGVSKPQSKAKSVRGRPVRRQQRLRRSKGQQRAENVLEQREQKQVRTRDSTKRIRERRGAWEEVNGKISTKKDRRRRKNTATGGGQDETENASDSPLPIDEATETTAVSKMGVIEEAEQRVNHQKIPIDYDVLDGIE